MNLELYYTEPSPFARKVRVMLLEKGLPFTLIDVRTDTRKAKDKNPLGKVPTLLVDGEPFYDSVVLTEYLDAAFPDPALIPRAPYERACVRRFEALADGISDVIIPVVQDRRRPEELRNLAMAEAMLGKARASLQALETAVGDRPYLFAEAFTLADIAAVSTIGYVGVRMPELLEGHQGLLRYQERQLERPSLRQTIPLNLPPLS